MSNIVIRHDEIKLIIGEGPTAIIKHFPNSGVIIAVEKVSAAAVHEEGQNGTSTDTIMTGRSHTFTTTVVARSPSDFHLERVLKAQTAFQKLPSLNFTWGTTVMAAGLGSLTTAPTREVAADSSPARVWVLTGSFGIFFPGFFEVAEPLTEAEIKAGAPA